ncbi:MAG: glycosyltransferase family 2 protein [Ferruginibacter sp.]
MNNLIQLSANPTAESIETFYKQKRVAAQSERKVAQAPKSTLYLWIFGSWILSLLWFEPRLIQLLTIAETPLQYASLIVFIIFIDFAWLYGLYNISIVLFAVYYKLKKSGVVDANAPALLDYPPVALLYTTCNDFVEDSALSCVNQDYLHYRMYILDDSSDESFKRRIDDFAMLDPDRIVVVRRPDRKGFKAGNLNYALKHIANREKYFAIADADEILPTDFLSKLVPIMENNPTYGFVQANHKANPASETRLQKDMGIGINTHWKWYQPLRNDYGFVMFLGHGALLRYDCWKMINGFPDIVSEDLGFAIAIREKGYKGWFEEKVVCYEDFPDSVRSFRIRHMKWTRGTCEFLHKKMWWLIKAKNISFVEKADILFPTLNLPLTLVFFLFMINTNLVMPYLFGFEKNMTLVLAGSEYVLPITALDTRFSMINTPDFYAITILTFFAPVLCFIMAMRKTPVRLFRFLAHSTALYAALSILSAVGVITYLISGKAIFLVTGDKNQSGKQSMLPNASIIMQFKNGYQQFIQKSHPDSFTVQALEIIVGIVFLIAGLKMMQISFFGLCLGFLMLPVLHHTGWERRWMRPLVYLPFVFILGGVLLSSLSIMGMQSVFFGYGFHF